MKEINTYEEMEKYISDKYAMNESYRLSWFEIMTYRETKYVIFGVGRWTYHLMDWRGCNFWHGRLPASPIFEKTEDALEWLNEKVKKEIYKDNMELPGHFFKEDYESTCRTRECDIHISWEYNQSKKVIGISYNKK